MPKSKKQKLNTLRPSHSKHHDKRKPSKPANPKQTSRPTPQKPKQQPQHRAPIIPFDVFDPILLVGEGDLSFTLSLLHDHGCASLTTTTYDSHAQLLEKYPQASSALSQILTEDQTILHDIDATNLSSHKKLRKHAPFERIIFNFPHVGGAKSTDVNRQVRANQALLSSFFSSAIPLLSASGTILITLFEGDPYTLWNIRDLARHAGLVVRRSWKFDKDVYPLYKHARTLGVVKTREGGVSESAWRGEERPARTYEFGLEEAAKEEEDKSLRGKKREGDDSDDSD